MKKTSMVTAMVLVVGWASISGCRADTSTLVSPTPSASPTKIKPTPTRKPATPTFTLTPSPNVDLLPLPTWAGPVPEGAYARFFKGWLSDMAVSADGKRLALAGSLGVYVYATDTFQIKWNAATSEALSSADFSPDGTLLAAGSLDGGKIYLWDAETGTLVRKFMHGTDAIKVAFSPNGQTLAIKSWMEDYIVLYDIQPLKMIDIIGLDADCFNEMVFSPDGTIIACSTFKDTVALLDTADGGILRILDPEQGQIDNIMFLPDGKTVVSMGGGFAILWDIESGGRLHDYCPYGTIAWSLSGKVIASTGPQDSINLWDPASGELLRTIADPDHVFIVKDFDELLFLGDDDHLAGLSLYGPVIAWDLASGRVVRMMEDFTNWADFLGFSPDGRSLAVTSYGGFFRWEVPQNEKPSSAPNLLFRLENIKSGVLSPNGEFLTQISAEDEQTTITLLDLSTGIPVWFRVVQSRGLSMAFSPDGKILASVDFTGEIIFWRVADGGRIRAVVFPEGFINDVAFSNDGSQFAAASREGVVRVWDMESGENIATFVDEGYRSSNLCLVFSPVGNDLFFLIRDFRIMKWDGIPGHSAVVDRELVKGPLFSARTLLSISPDGQWFAVVFRESGSIAGSKSVIRIFPLADGSTEWETVGSHNSTISQIGFSPDGKTLASSSSDGTVVLWDIEDATS